MNVSDLNFEFLPDTKNEYMPGMKTKCLRNIVVNKYERGYQKTAELLEKANSTKEFVELIENCEDLYSSHIFGRLIRFERDYSRRCVEALTKVCGEEYFVFSDAASVLLRCNGFWTQIYNGFGNGRTSVFVNHDLDDEKRAHRFLKQQTIIYVPENGAIIPKSDCAFGEQYETALTLPQGRYGVYTAYSGDNSSRGIVLFEKWPDPYSY